jgi:hypothetical protein
LDAYLTLSAKEDETLWDSLSQDAALERKIHEQKTLPTFCLFNISVV